MTIPGKRLSSRHRKTRAAHHALAKVTTVACSNCQQQILPHAVCPFCGNHYRDQKKVEATPAAPATKE